MKYKQRYLQPFNTENHWAVGVQWEVEGSKNNTYTVELHDKGFTCSCPGFGFHGKCKHSVNVAGGFDV